MQQTKKSKKHTLISKLLCASLLTVSCARIPIQDAEVCYDAGEMGAACFHTNSDKERDLKKQEWDQVRFGWGCLSPDDIGALKGAIEKLCRETKLCDKQFKVATKAFFLRTENIQSRLGAIPCPDCEN